MIELYTLPGCPYCKKVEHKLEELAVPYEKHEVPASRAARTEVQAISGQSGVPVIVDADNGVSGMAESADIVSYLDRVYAE